MLIAAIALSSPLLIAPLTITNANENTQYPLFTEVQFTQDFNDKPSESAPFDNLSLKQIFGEDSKAFQPEFQFQTRATATNGSSSLIEFHTFDIHTGTSSESLAQDEITLMRDDAQLLGVTAGDTVSLQHGDHEGNVTVASIDGTLNLIPKHSVLGVIPNTDAIEVTTSIPGLHVSWVAPGHISHPMPLPAVNTRFHGPGKYASPILVTDSNADQTPLLLLLAFVIALCGFTIVCATLLLMPIQTYANQHGRLSFWKDALLLSTCACVIGTLWVSTFPMPISLKSWLLTLIPVVLCAAIALFIARRIRSAEHKKTVLLSSILSIACVIAIPISALGIFAIPYPPFAERAHHGFWCTPTGKPISSTAIQEAIPRLAKQFGTTGHIDVFSSFDPITFEEPLLYGRLPAHSELKDNRYDPFATLKYNQRVTEGAYVYIVSPTAPEALQSVFPDHYSDQQTHEAYLALADGKAVVNDEALIERGQTTIETKTAATEPTAHRFDAHLLQSSEFPTRQSSIMITPDTAKQLGVDVHLSGMLFHNIRGFSLQQRYHLDLLGTTTANADDVMHIHPIGRDYTSAATRSYFAVSFLFCILVATAIAIAGQYDNRKLNIWAAGIGSLLGIALPVSLACISFTFLGEAERISGIPWLPLAGITMLAPIATALITTNTAPQRQGTVNR